MARTTGETSARVQVRASRNRLSPYRTSASESARIDFPCTGPLVSPDLASLPGQFRPLTYAVSMRFPYDEFDLSAVRTYPLRSRTGKARAEDFGRPIPPAASVRAFI